MRITDEFRSCGCEAVQFLRINSATLQRTIYGLSGSRIECKAVDEYSSETMTSSAFRIKTVSAKRFVPKDRRLRRLNRFRQVLARVGQNPLLCVIPLILILLVALIDFSTFEYALVEPDTLFEQRGVGVADSSDVLAVAEVRQKSVQAVAYGLLLFLILARLRSITGFFLRERTLLFLMFGLMVGYLFSGYPVKVATNAVHAFFGVAAAVVFVHSIKGRSNVIQSVHVVVLIAAGLVQIGSLLTWANLDVSGFDYLSRGWRYGGLAGHPNNLGSVSMIACWSGFALSADRTLQIRWRVLAFSVCLLAIASAVLADSVTTFVVIAVLAGFTLWEYFLSSFAAPVQQVINATLIAAALIVTPFGLWFVAQQDSVLGTVSESLTGDATLTGRTNIWDIGWGAIKERPVFGWSYDSHQTVFDDSRFTLPYTQYHNGYIDILVTGGILLFALLVWQLLTTFRRYRSLRRSGMHIFSVQLFMGILMLQNISEWSLLRPVNPLWQVYVVCAVALAVLVFTNSEPPVKQVEKVPLARRRLSGRTAIRF